VKKGINPYIQVWFGNGTGGQAMDIHDHSIKSDQAEEIAPLFNAPEFEQFASETVNMHVLFAEIASKTDTQIGYNLKGGRPLFDRVTREPIKDPVTDKQKVSVADCKTNQECFDKMLSSSEKWRTWGLNLAENINTPIDLPDPRHPSYRINKARIDLIRKIKVSRVGDSGVGALIRAIQPHLPNKGFIMPNELSDPVLFKQRYAQMLLDRNWRHEFGEIPFAPDVPAPDQI
jgi:hypothetical protein